MVILPSFPVEVRTVHDTHDGASSISKGYNSPLGIQSDKQRHRMRHIRPHTASSRVTPQKQSCCQISRVAHGQAMSGFGKYLVQRARLQQVSTSSPATKPRKCCKKHKDQELWRTMLLKMRTVLFKRGLSRNSSYKLWSEIGQDEVMI
jgi:hypothetical protein